MTQSARLYTILAIFVCRLSFLRRLRLHHIQLFIGRLVLNTLHDEFCYIFGNLPSRCMLFTYYVEVFVRLREERMPADSLGQDPS